VKSPLAAVPLFERLPADELRHLEDTLRLHKLNAGEVLFNENDEGEMFYIIKKGQLEVIKSLGTYQERAIAVREAGEYVGEMGLVNQSSRRTATVRAVGPAQVWEMSHAEFDELLNRQPTFSREVIRVLSNRLSDAHDRTIKDLTAKNYALTLAFEELKSAQIQLIEKERMERELQMGQDIQMSILPSDMPIVPGFEFGERIIPARMVGGDFYDVIDIGDGQVVIFIGDVADKGVPSALFMAQVHALLYAESRRGLTPAEVLTQVNTNLLEMNTANLFVTVLYGILDTRSGKFAYARAGHEVPLVVGKSGEAQPVPWNKGQLLGVLPLPEFDCTTATLEPGSYLVLYTDGMLDLRNPARETFGMQKLLQTASGLNALSAREICDQMIDAISAYNADVQQDDDVTLLIVKATP
jgi:serine phosphatase RsbU (regulator of sigma subunit)